MTDSGLTNPEITFTGRSAAEAFVARTAANPKVAEPRRKRFRTFMRSCPPPAPPQVAENSPHAWRLFFFGNAGELFTGFAQNPHPAVRILPKGEEVLIDAP